MDSPTEKATEARFDCFITIKAHVFNARPTPPTTVTFGLEVETTSGHFEATRTTLDGQILRVERRVTAAVPQLSQLKYHLEEMAELAPSGRIPLTQGQEGWLRFVIREEDAPMRDMQAITLLAIDDYGQAHRIRSERGQWKQTGELARKRDIEHEEILARRLDDAFRS